MRGWGGRRGGGYRFCGLGWRAWGLWRGMGTYRDEGDQIWWGGESLGLQGCVAHLFNNSREEDGKAGEGDVGAEEHQGCQVALRINQGPGDFSPLEPSRAIAFVLVAFLRTEP